MREGPKNFYDLDAWKLSRILVKRIYKIIKKFPKYENFNIVDQMRRAVVSIPANIAEGYARYYFKEKIRFYYIARGSLAEIQTFIVIAYDVGYINKDIMESVIEETISISKLINGLIRSNKK